MSAMRVVSVNVGLPQVVTWNGRTSRTSILKTPVSGPTRVRRHNLEGDKQADRLRHGGAQKAVCVYPVEHYAFWRDELPGIDLPHGAFGENLTLEGWLEDVARIGDRLSIGSAEFAITQPRLPCVKLQRRLGGHDMIRRVLASRRTGYYLSVVREGDVESGDAVHVTRAGEDVPTISSLVPPPRR